MSLGSGKPFHPASAQPAAPQQPKLPDSAQAAPEVDTYYGHENTANLCARFITHLFACPEYPPRSSGSSVKLPYFIAYALHRTDLHSSVTFATLVLLQRLRARFPTARGSSGHRLFLSAFMIASKVICDYPYSNKSWSIVGQGVFRLRDINQMEREVCQYLDWELNVEPGILKEFEDMVRKDFAGPGPYPTYVLQTISKLSAPSAKPLPVVTPNNSTSSQNPSSPTPIGIAVDFAPIVEPNDSSDSPRLAIRKTKAHVVQAQKMFAIAAPSVW